MDDYNEIIELIQSELGSHYVQNPDMINLPGKSLTCKIDSLYYLALPKPLLDTLAQWTGILPEKIADTLVRTGIMVSSEGDRNYIIPLKLIYSTVPQSREADCCLLDAGFIDRTLTIYGGLIKEMPISSLRIHESCKSALEVFLKGKPPLAALAFDK